MQIEKSFTTELFEAIYPVALEQDGMRLDQFVQLYMPSFSRQRVKFKIKQGEVEISGRTPPHRPSAKVYFGEKIRIFTPKGDLEDEYWYGEKVELELVPQIIFEDDNIVAIAKPPYMATHPTGRHLFNCATVFLENKYGHTIHSIHRIDRETSGVLLLGKTPEASSKASTLFELDQVHKCYFFMSKLNDEKIEFPLTAYERLGTRDDYIPRLFNHCFPENSHLGKHAETTFKHLHTESGYLLGLAFPKTGRQHQIRSHAAFHGFPLVGDKLYNGDPKIFMRFKDGIATDDDHEIMELPRHALHATALKLSYPSENNPSIFRAKIPKDFISWMHEKKFSISIEALEKKMDEIIFESFKKGKNV